MENTTLKATLASESLSPRSWLYIGFESVLGLVICAGNGLVIAAVWRAPGLRTATNVLVVCLALSDLMVGLSMPYHILVFVIPSLKKGFITCMARYWTVVFCSGSSALFLVGTGVDRCVAILLPAHYQSALRVRNMLVAAALMWLYVLIISLLPFLGLHRWHPHEDCDLLLVMHPIYILVVVAGHGLAGVAVIAVLYLFILKAAISRRRIKPGQVAPLSNVATLSAEMTSNHHREKKHKKFKEDLKLAKNIAIVVVVNAVCVCPYSCLLIFLLAGEAQVTEHVLGLLQVACFVLVISNSAMNPVIYAARMPAFRREFHHLLKCACARRA